MVKTSAYRKFLSDLTLTFRVQAGGQRFGSDEVIVTVIVGSRHDIDALKPVGDALQASGIIDDDRQISALLSMRGEVRDQLRVLVRGHGEAVRGATVLEQFGVMV